MRRSLPAALLLSLLCTAPAAAQSKEMDYGPFLAATFQIKSPANNTVLRGVAVPFEGQGQSAKAGVIFDTELLRYAAGWTGGFVKLEGVAFNGAHGTNPSPIGQQVFGTKPTPGWAKGGDLKDPRDIAHGPLPRDWARY